MTATPLCDVCCERPSTIICPYCHYPSCSTCFTTYQSDLTSHTVDCMNCHHPITINAIITAYGPNKLKPFISRLSDHIIDRQLISPTIQLRYSSMRYLYNAFTTGLEPTSPLGSHIMTNIIYAANCIEYARRANLTVLRSMYTSLIDSITSSIDIDSSLQLPIGHITDVISHAYSSTNNSGTLVRSIIGQLSRQSTPTTWSIRKQLYGLLRHQIAIDFGIIEDVFPLMDVTRFPLTDTAEVRAFNDELLRQSTFAGLYTYIPIMLSAGTYSDEFIISSLIDVVANCMHRNEASPSKPSVYRERIESAMSALAMDEVATALLYFVNDVAIGSNVKQNIHNIITSCYNAERKHRLGASIDTYYVGRCGEGGCDGFITSKYTCTKCHRRFCERCMHVAEKDHECDPNEIESVRLMRMSSKPCPQCCSPVYKAEGCAQMFCTWCHARYDYATGRFITSDQFHNPHEIEWRKLHERNDGTKLEKLEASVGMVNMNMMIRPTLRADEMKDAMNALKWDGSEADAEMMVLKMWRDDMKAVVKDDMKVNMKMAETMRTKLDAKVYAKVCLMAVGDVSRRVTLTAVTKLMMGELTKIMMACARLNVKREELDVYVRWWKLMERTKAMLMERTEVGDTDVKRLMEDDVGMWKEKVAEVVLGWKEVRHRLMVDTGASERDTFMRQLKSTFGITRMIAKEPMMANTLVRLMATNRKALGEVLRRMVPMMEDVLGEMGGVEMRGKEYEEAMAKHLSVRKADVKV